MTDEELVRRMQRGDMQAFDELYERYKDDAYRVACLITGNRADGEDLTQEAFVTAARSIGSLKDGSKFRPWLLRTLSRAAWKYCRKAGRETPVAEFFESGESESALSAVLRTDEQRQLYQARAHARRDRGDGQIPPVFRPPPSAAGADRKRGKAEGGCYKWMN